VKTRIAKIVFVAVVLWIFCRTANAAKDIRRADVALALNPFAVLFAA
jgi:hypothetical protein